MSTFMLMTCFEFEIMNIFVKLNFIMKKLYTLSFLLFGTLISNAQLSLTPNQTAVQLANQLVATSGTLGVVVSNANLTCDTNSNGLFTGVSNFGINNGIVLGTGEIMTTGISPNFSYGLNGLPGDFASQGVNKPGDSVLANIVTMQTYDACVLEFDLVPVGNFVEFEYVFGSEEYPEFNCSAFNDIFAFHISGPGFATPTNIALIPNTTTPVSINSINDGTNNCSAYQNLYVTNNDTTNTLDGFTTPLIAQANVTPNQTYHLRLAIADVSDMIFNSYVLLKANSLKSGNTTPSIVSDLASQNGLTIYPTRLTQQLTIENNSNDQWSIEILNVEGQIVYRNTLSQLYGKSTFDLGSLSRGVLVVKMKNSRTEKVITQKIVKE